MNTVSGQWMVFVAGWQCFFGATRSSSTARIHRAPPSFPLPRSSSTPSPLLPLPNTFGICSTPFNNSCTQSSLTRREMTWCPGPWRHPCRTPHRSTQPRPACTWPRWGTGQGGTWKQIFCPTLFWTSLSHGWRPGTAAAAVAAAGSCSWQQQQSGSGLHRGGGQPSSAHCPHTPPRFRGSAYLRGRKPNCLPPTLSCDGMGSAQGDAHLYR